MTPTASSRPRLLLLITLAERGGAQSYVAALLPAVAARFEVTLAAHGPGPLREAAREAGVEFVALEHVRRELSLWRDPLGLIELVRLMRRRRPDIVHTNSSKAGVLGRLAARIAAVPITIFTAHGWAFNAHSGAAALAYRWADRAARPITSAIICVAEHERLAGLAAGTCGAEQTVVIANAVDVQAMPRRTPQDRPMELISVGRLREPKDFITLARALARLDPDSFRASFVGDGPDRSAIEAELHRLGLSDHVRLLGERSDVPRLLAQADVFVCSSRSEGMPVSIIEAMASGLAVVASAVGGVPELVLDGHTGFLVAAEAEAPLADALTQLARDRSLRERFGRAGRERAAARFDLRPFRAAHLELYERLLAERGLPKRALR